MAVSESYDFSKNRNEFLTTALRKAKLIGAGETPASDLMDIAILECNLLMKEWQNLNYGLWLHRRATLFLESGTAKYKLGTTGDHCSADIVETTLSASAAAGASSITVSSIAGIVDNDVIGILLDDNTLQFTTVNGTPTGYTVALDAALTGAATSGKKVYAYTSKIPRPNKVISARYKQGNYEYDLIRMTETEYDRNPYKTMAGVPGQFYYSPQMPDGEFYVFPVPNIESAVITLTLQFPVSDLDSATDDLEIPSNWYTALLYHLAIRLADGSGMQISQITAQTASAALQAARYDDTEGSGVQFTVNYDYR